MDLNIDLLTQILEEEYNLLVAKDGAQGVDMVSHNQPDLVLMDISLPVMDGYEATRRIHHAFPALPVIGLSAHAMSGDSDRALAAGCVDYMTKPIDIDLLMEKVNRLIG
jgi:CheY-like chemotaxis protein